MGRYYIYDLRMDMCVSKTFITLDEAEYALSLVAGIDRSEIQKYLQNELHRYEIRVD